LRLRGRAAAEGRCTAEDRGTSGSGPSRGLGRAGVPGRARARAGGRSADGLGARAGVEPRPGVTLGRRYLDEAREEERLTPTLRSRCPHRATHIGVEVGAPASGGEQRWGGAVGRGAAAAWQAARAAAGG
jgi:hypothetical protein